MASGINRNFVLFTSMTPLSGALRVCWKGKLMRYMRQVSLSPLCRWENRFRELCNLLKNHSVNKWQNRNFGSDLIESNILLINYEDKHIFLQSTIALESSDWHQFCNKWKIKWPFKCFLPLSVRNSATQSAGRSCLFPTSHWVKEIQPDGNELHHQIFCFVQLTHLFITLLALWRNHCVDAHSGTNSLSAVDWG